MAWRTDKKNEQAQNLIDALGFDPNEDPTRFSSQVPQPTDERTGFPENWKALFHINIKESAIIDQKHGGGVIVEDPENLFSIRDRRRYNGTDNEFAREYYRYVGRLHRVEGQHGFVGYEAARFEPSSYAFLPAATDEKQRILLLTRSDNSQVSSIEFNGHRNPGDDPIEIEKSGIGGREFTVGYDKDGNVGQVNFHIRYTRDDMDADGVPDVYTDQYSLGEYRYEGRWYSGGGRNDIGKLEMEEDKKTGRVILRRIEDGEVKDEMEFPMKIDPQALKERWLHDALLKDPRNPDTRLDEKWRGVDFFHDAGLRWDAVADDKLHSLTKIPKPAPDA